MFRDDPLKHTPTVELDRDNIAATRPRPRPPKRRWICAKCGEEDSKPDMLCRPKPLGHA